MGVDNRTTLSFVGVSDGGFRGGVGCVLRRYAIPRCVEVPPRFGLRIMRSLCRIGRTHPTPDKPVVNPRLGVL